MNLSIVSKLIWSVSANIIDIAQALNKIFSPVRMPVAIHIVLSIAFTQLVNKTISVSNNFLHGEIQEEVYMN